MRRSSGIALTLLIVSLLGLAARSAGPLIDTKIGAAFADLDLLRSAVRLEAKQLHRLPTDAEGLKLLLEKPAVIEHLAADPWHRAYVYRRTSEAPGFVVYSVGADGIDDHGAGDDVTTRDKSYDCAVYGPRCPTDAVSLATDGCVAVALGSLAMLALNATRRRSRARVTRDA